MNMIQRIYKNFLQNQISKWSIGWTDFGALHTMTEDDMVMSELGDMSA